MDTLEANVDVSMSYDLEPSRPFRLTEYCREYHRHCLHVTSLYENVPVSLRASHRYPFSFRIRSS